MSYIEAITDSVMNGDNFIEFLKLKNYANIPYIRDWIDSENTFFSVKTKQFNARYIIIDIIHIYTGKFHSDNPNVIHFYNRLFYELVLIPELDRASYFPIESKEEFLHNLISLIFLYIGSCVGKYIEEKGKQLVSYEKGKSLIEDFSFLNLTFNVDNRNILKGLNTDE